MTLARPAKVLFVMTFGERHGGCEGMLWTFLRGVDRSRIQPAVIFNTPGRFVEEVRELGIPVAVIEHGRLRQPIKQTGAILRLRRAFARERPDLIVSWFTKAQLYASPAAVAAGMRRRNVWFQHTLPGGTDLDPAATLLPARAIGATSAAGARAQQRIRPRRPTFVVTPGIDEPRVASRSELEHLRGELGLPAGEAVVGIVGRMQPWKQHDLLVRAIARLRADGQRVHGLVVGGTAYDRDPEYYPSVRRLVDELGIAEAVTFTDQVADAHPYIQLMDVLVNASVNEPFGIVLLEAMALHVPAIALDTDGGPPEILAGGRAGLLARPRDPDDLAAQILRLLEGRELRDRVVAEARRRFETHYTSARMTEELEERLLELVAAAG